MKGRESGMPDEACWASFFDAGQAITNLFGEHALQGDTVEFGCGYGTFTLPASRKTQGIVTALDIEAEMVAAVHQKAEQQQRSNIQTVLRDFVTDGTGLSDGTQAHAMLYNLLHIEHPVALFREAHRVLVAGGIVSVIHWRSDIPTPRGPSLDIRPSPQQCHTWMQEAGFTKIEPVDLTCCCPFHFGLVGWR